MSFEGINRIPKKGAPPIEKYQQVADVLKERTANLPPVAANDNQVEASAANDNEFGSEDLGPTVRKMIGRE